MRLVCLILIACCLVSCIRDLTNDIGCAVLMQTATMDSCLIYIPNIITPNADGVNDGFQYVSACEFEAYRLTISNGSRTIFESTDPLTPWDGRQDVFSSTVAFGVLSYEMVFRNGLDSIIATGTITVAPFDPDGDELTFALTECASCTFPDQIDPEKGVIFDTKDQLDRICAD